MASALATFSIDYQDTRCGDHGTYHIGTDQWPVTVVNVKREGRQIEVQFDRAIETRAKGRYLVARNPRGAIETFYWSPASACYVRGPHGALQLGSWQFFRDPAIAAQAVRT